MTSPLSLMVWMPSNAMPRGGRSALREVSRSPRTSTVVDNVSFAVSRGEILGVVGESGCGKSVLMLSILGLVPGGGHVVAGRCRLAFHFATRRIYSSPQRVCPPAHSSKSPPQSSIPNAFLNVLICSLLPAVFRQVC